MSIGRFLVIAAILLGVAALSATPSLAAKGGKEKPGTAGPTGSSIALNEAAPHLGGQATFMRAQSCDLLQGFLFSKPVPASECAGLLQTHPSRWLTLMGD